MINKRYEKVRFNKGTVTYWIKCTNCDFSKYVTLSALAQYPKTRKCPVCGRLIYPIREGLEETNKADDTTDVSRRPDDIIGHMECAECETKSVFTAKSLNDMINKSIKGEHVDCPVCHDNRLFVKIDFNELVKAIQGGR